MTNELDQLRSEVQIYHLRFIVALLVGASTFLVFLLPSTKLFDAAKLVAIGVFVLCWIYAVVVWFMLFGARRRLRSALRAPN